MAGLNHTNPIRCSLVPYSLIHISTGEGGMSKAHIGRASGESITLIMGDEIVKQYQGDFDHE